MEDRRGWRVSEGKTKEEGDARLKRPKTKKTQTFSLEKRTRDKHLVVGI